MRVPGKIYTALLVLALRRFGTDIKPCQWRLFRDSITAHKRDGRRYWMMWFLLPSGTTRTVVVDDQGKEHVFEDAEKGPKTGGVA